MDFDILTAGVASMDTKIIAFSGLGTPRPGCSHRAK